MEEEQNLSQLFEEAIFIACTQEKLLPRECKNSLRLCSKRIKLIVDSGKVGVSPWEDELDDFFTSDLLPNTNHFDFQGRVRPATLEKILSTPMPSLRQLRLGFVEAAELSKVAWPQVTLLTIDNLEGSSLPAWMENLPALKELHVESDSLETLSSGISKLTSLETLDLSCKSMSMLPESLGSLSNLSSLSLRRYDDLALVPASIGDLSRLQQLSIDAKTLLELPDQMSKLKSLTALSLANCAALASLPDLSPLTALQTLSLYGCNGLATLPSWLGRVTSLRELSIGESDRVDFFPPF